MVSGARSAGRQAWLDDVPRYGLLGGFLVIFAIFAAMSPTFLTTGNIVNVLVNNFALLAIVTLGVTLSVAVGGIDLSVGTALDFASLAFISLLASGQSFAFAVAAALAAGACVGLFNSFLIVGLRISPFLATLGTLFIGRSLQLILTSGGNPVHVFGAKVPPEARFLGRGQLLGVPISLYILLVLIVAISILLARTRFGRSVAAIGNQQTVAWYSGIRVGRITGIVFVMGGIMGAIAGIVLSATVNAYIPSSGNAFLLNSIGATFIGTALSRHGRANVPGAMLGVLLLSFVANGLLLIGWNFFWQQVGTGIVIYLVLAATFAGRRTQI